MKLIQILALSLTLSGAGHASGPEAFRSGAEEAFFRPAMPKFERGAPGSIEGVPVKVFDGGAREGTDVSWGNDFLDLPSLSGLSTAGVELQILADVFLAGHKDRVYGNEDLMDIIARDRAARNAPRGFLDELRSTLFPKPSGLITELARMNFRGKLDLQILAAMLASKAVEDGQVDSSEAVVVWSVLVKIAKGKHGGPLYGSLGDDRSWTEYMKAAIELLDKHGYAQLKRSWGFAGEIKSVKPSGKLSLAIERHA